MNVRFYIDMRDEGSEIVADLKTRLRAAEEAEKHYYSITTRYGGLAFKQNEEGTYVEYPHFLFGVPTAITDELGLTVRRVELEESFPMPWRDGEEPQFKMPRGVYKQDDAQAIVDEFRLGDDTRNSRRVRVVADGVDAATVLFNLVRKGEAEPIEPWRDEPLNKTDEVEDE